MSNYNTVYMNDTYIKYNRPNFPISTSDSGNKNLHKIDFTNVSEGAYLFVFETENKCCLLGYLYISNSSNKLDRFIHIAHSIDRYELHSTAIDIVLSSTSSVTSRIRTLSLTKL